MRFASLIGCLFTFVLLCGCQTNPATGKMQFIALPPSEVAQMGEAAKPELIKEYGGELPSQPVREYVDGIGRSLLEHIEPEFADLDWEFIVLDSEVVNAFALPGGKVFVSRGLMEQFDNEAQLAGVIGHEIGHVTGRHIDERISQSMALQGVLVGLGMTEADWAQVTQLVVGAAGQGYMLSFGRGQESEADRLGLRYMVRAGYDPHGLLEVMEVFQQLAAGPRPPEFLSTHPHPETRIRQINGKLADEYAHTQDNPDYGKFHDRYQEQALAHLRAFSGPGHPVADALLTMYGCGGCCGGHH